MHYSNEQIAAIKSRTNIVQLIESFGTKLTKNGQGHKGLCPFHNDKNTPSFSVDEKKGLFYCFGADCPANKGGDVITFVQLAKGLSFQEAVKFLAERNGTPSSLPARNYASATTAAKPIRENFSEKQKRDTLARVVEVWQNNLAQSKSAQAALKKERGIFDNQVIRDFRIGFSTGNLEKMVKEKSEQQELLQEIGVLNDEGREVFKGFLVFPIFAEDRVVGVYGRNVRQNAKFKHQFLRGKHQGVYNERALKVYDEIILCESIIDCLTLYVHGFKNVTCTYGLNGLTAEIESALKTSKISKVYFAFDNEQQAEKKAREYARKFPKITSKLVQLPEEAKDINEYFVSCGYQAEQFKALLLGSRLLHTADDLPFDVEEVQEKSLVHYLFNMEQFSIKVSGVPRHYTPPLKCTIKMSYLPENRFHYDNVDLFSAQRRAAFSGQVSRMFGIDQLGVEEIFGQILEYLEKRNVERTETPHEEEGQAQVYEMSEDEKKEALKLLKDTNLARQIVRDMEDAGYVGEKANSLLAYLIGVSRKMDEPLAGIILSRSSAGKSALMNTVEKLTPPEDLVPVTVISDQALFYFKKNQGLRHKLVTLGEHQGFENVEYLLRELVSKHSITKAVSKKDEDGEIETRMITVKGPIALLDTSAHPDLNEENFNRSIIIHINESKKQTRKILQYQKQSMTKDGFYKKIKKQKLSKRHHNAQRLLKNIAIHNPFAPLIDFPDSRITVRRDHLKFQHLILVITFLHQYQRKEKNMYVHNQEVKYIESTLDDYRTAYKLFTGGILQNSLSSIPKMARDLHALIIQMRRETAKRENKKERDVLFTRKQTVEFSGFTLPQVRNYCQILEDFEVLEVANGGKGRSAKQYRLLVEKLEDINLAMIPTPEELEEKYIEEK